MAYWQPSTDPAPLQAMGTAYSPQFIWQISCHCRTDMAYWQPSTDPAPFQAMGTAYSPQFIWQISCHLLLGLNLAYSANCLNCTITEKLLWLWPVFSCNAYLLETCFSVWYILQSDSTKVLLSFRQRFPEVHVPYTKGSPKISLQRINFNLSGD